MKFDPQDEGKFDARFNEFCKSNATILMAAAQYSSSGVVRAIMFDGLGNNSASMVTTDNKFNDVTDYANRRIADKAEIVQLVKDEFAKRRRNEKRALDLPPSPAATRGRTAAPGAAPVAPIPFNFV